MRFLVDAQLPPGLAAWLRSRGHEASHVMDDVGLHATDSDIWELARRDGRIIISKDKDFAIRATSRSDGPQIVWVRLGNTTSRTLIAWLERHWSEIERHLGAQVRVVEAGRPRFEGR